MSGQEGRPIRTVSLRAHLLLLVIGTLLPTLVVAAFLVRRVVSENRGAVERRLLEAARAAAATVDAELVGTIRALQGLGESDRLTIDDIPSFYTQAQRLLATQPTWSAVTLLKPDGRQIVNTAREFGDPLVFVIDRDSFTRAVETRTPAIGNLRVGQVTRELGFPVRVPVARDNRVVYVVSAWITSSSFSNVLRRDSSMSDEWVRGIVDPAGVLVARSRDPERYVGRKGTASFLDRSRTAEQGVYRDIALDGTAVYGAFSRAPRSRWVAGVAVPASIVDASFRQSMITLAGVAVFLLGVGGGGAYLISRRISHEIGRSAVQAEAIAGGLRPTRPPSRVTEIQRLLDALTRSAALLDTRQRERDEQLARADLARAEAEAANRSKDEFLAMLGHELRNPLAPALTALHLMKLRADERSTRERDVLERQLRHMARLVDDLLDVSRLQRGAIELRRERFDLADAVARAVEMTTPAVAEKQQRLDVDVAAGLDVDADQIRIAQVLSNLLANAAKYTERGGHITLRAREDDGFAVIECSDNGVGMAADLVPRVFDLFVQGQRGLDRQQGGLGLGLAVARSLVQLHGGTIEAASAGANLGSTFRVRLPLAAPGAASATTGAEVTASQRPPMVTGPILVVDDNCDALEMLLVAFQQAGLPVFGASTAEEALDLAARLKPSAAVLDIGLPGMDGFELARTLRSRANGGALRLIALTGYGREQDMAAAEAAGFDAFFVKPAEISALVGALYR